MKPTAFDRTHIRNCTRAPTHTQMRRQNGQDSGAPIARGKEKDIHLVKCAHTNIHAKMNKRSGMHFRLCDHTCDKSDDNEYSKEAKTAMQTSILDSRPLFLFPPPLVP